MELMMKEALVKVAEVELVYKSKVKASERPTIQTSADAVNVLRVLWEEGGDGAMGQRVVADRLSASLRPVLAV